MKRRSFFSLLAGAAGIPLLPKTHDASYIVGVDPACQDGDKTSVFVYDPAKYKGEWEWQNIPQPTAKISNEVLDRIYARLI